MRKRLYIATLIGLALIGCAAPVTSMPLFATTSATATAPPTAVIPTETATSMPTQTDTANETPESVTGDPTIGEIRFVAPTGNTDGLPAYPADVPSVDVEISYSGLVGDLIVRREWLLNGAVWLDVEAIWHSEWRGMEGVWQITLHGPLPPGIYELRVYVDEQPVFDTVDVTSRSFVVEAPADGSHPPLRPPDYRGIRVSAPDGSQAALVHDWGTIVVQEANGSEHVLVTAHTIGDLAWFPDQQYLVYRNLLPEGETGDFLGTGSQLYVVNVETGATNRIGRSDERWRRPQVSPDGTMIAVVGGSGFSDACMSDTYAGIIRLDEDKQRQDVLWIGSFAGIPGDFAEIRLRSDLAWVSQTAVEVNLDFDCMGTPEASGKYILDITTMTATLTEAFIETPIPPQLSSIITFTTDPSTSENTLDRFPAGTQRIYALVYYLEMREGIQFRREWYRNGELWLVREEPWDFTKYGAYGTLTDLSIFTDKESLPPGTYELRLYLDGVAQFNIFVGFANRSFVIAGSDD